MIRNIQIAFINKQTSYIDRIQCAWKTVFLTRFWYIWLSSKTISELDSILIDSFSLNVNRKKNTKQQYFMTLPAMFSIEINSHTLVYLALLVIQHHLPVECLNISLFNSQTCENTFRLCRAMSGPFSSIVNFTVHQFLQRAKKLSYLNSVSNQSIVNNQDHPNGGFLFPRHHKQSRADNEHHINFATSSSSTFTIEAVEAAVLQAYSDAIRVVCDVNMYKRHQIPSLREMSKSASIQLQKSRIIDYSHLNVHDPEFDSDSDDDSSDEDHGVIGNEADDDDSSDDDNESYLNDHLFNLSSTNFRGMRVFDSINPTLAKSYFVVNINGTKKYLHKQTGAWLFSKDKPTLSSDRLKRVMTNE